MAPDGLRGFMQGRTEGLSDAARDAGSLVDGLLAAGRGGRDILRGLVRAEIDRALPRLGLATASEVDALRRDVDALSARLGTLEAGAGAAMPPPPRSTSGTRRRTAGETGTSGARSRPRGTRRGAAPTSPGVSERPDDE